MFPRRVVVTGMDAYSCLGVDLASISASLQSGRSGIVTLPEEPIEFRSRLSARLPEIDWQAEFSRRERKNMDQPALFAARAARRAVAMAGCEEQLREARTGLLIGNDSTAGATATGMETLKAEGSTMHLNSGQLLRGMNSTATINLAPMFGINGISMTLSGACASGGHAIGLGSMLIGMGLQDFVLAGGTQELNWQSRASFDSLRVFSTRMDEPTRASRPFDRDRDGLVFSGGAACLVLEAYDHARARGAEILAEVIGYSFSCDGFHETTSNGEGAERAIRECLERAAVGNDEVDYINAHATSTTLGDAAEAKAINNVFGDRCPPVASTKSMTGHECWMAGASEAIYSILMMRDRFMAPNINYEHADPKLPPLNVLAAPRLQTPVRTVLSNSFGFGGTNACLLLRRVDD